MAALILLTGDIPDPDRLAHDMWALQLSETGSLTISENAVTDNWRVYYPNTVPKPLELLIGFVRSPAGFLPGSLAVLLLASAAILSVYKASGGGGEGIAAAYFLGFNPVFVLLALRGNPAIPFITAGFLLQTSGGAGAGTFLAALSRPEGFLYGGWHCLRSRNWKPALLLGLAAAAWLFFHKSCCGSVLWASREVRYSVAAMAYPTPNPVTFLPWAGIRSILILGAPGAAILYGNIRRWKLAVPFGANFALLTLSLGFGSLVLPRYIDQLFLLATPFIFTELAVLLKGRRKVLVTALVIVFPWFQWISAIPEIREHADTRDFYRQTELNSYGVTAANELLIPGLALAEGIHDPRGLFVSSDRAAWENASEEELASFGVSRILVYGRGIYFPEHTRRWLGTLNDMEVVYYGE
ncbi:MAG TPA: hypothetical protein PLM22_01800 [Candidatus Sabulitectum sp.]|nr:hypothetical protein [Candidatus Sabulitectum sp.]HPF32455.1 hypothetical protein [Candidatus Sabulitectum sp.]HPJ27637.1 hypothetical protein [Candidatus Sabulitectum sp.]HPR21387.1 hypothetical protein [Candidatus Sabulitectum sp.]